MKKFFSVTPYEAKGKLHAVNYESVGNSLLEYGETRFPLIPLINGYTKPGDCIEVHTVTYDTNDCRHNYELLASELAQLCENNRLSYTLSSVDVPYDNSTEAVLRVFQKLIDRMADDDVLHACVTYGTKPMSFAVSMALQYAYRLKDNVSLECVVYGELDFSIQGPPWAAKIYDLTSLIKLDEIMIMLAGRGVENPESAIAAILGL